MDKKTGKIFLITGPSGAGKTDIAKAILANKRLNIKRIVTCTTRAPRTGEKNGKDYFFLTKEEFLKNIKDKKMFEYAEVYGNYYGSRKEDVEKLIKTGTNVLFITDVQGAVSLKKIDKRVVGIFLKAESITELKRRLTNRATDSKEVITKRINVALSELKLSNKFDYEVINPNGKIKEAINEIKNIILKK